MGLDPTPPFADVAAGKLKSSPPGEYRKHRMSCGPPSIPPNAARAANGIWIEQNRKNIDGTDTWLEKQREP